MYETAKETLMYRRVLSGFLSVSDSDRRVPAELGQESQASSCLRKGVKEFEYFYLTHQLRNLYFHTQLCFVVLFEILEIVKSYKSNNITRTWSCIQIYSSSEHLSQLSEEKEKLVKTDL